MTYAAHDVSHHLGNPVELFHFRLDGVDYRYAAYDDDVTTENDVVWTAAALRRDNFVATPDTNRASLQIHCSLQLPVIEPFRQGALEDPVKLLLYRTHVRDPDRQVYLLWEGEVTSFGFSGREANLRADVPESVLSSLGLRRMYQRTCSWGLYGPGCSLNKEDFRTDAFITSVNDTVISVDAPDCSIFAGGLLVYSQTGGRTLRRYVEHGAGSDVYLKRAASWLQIGETVALYRGCRKTMAACDTFGNLANFGGFPYMPEDNLFHTQVY